MCVDFDTVRALALVASIVLLLILAAIALLAAQPRTWK
jgi:hypothetical protein